MVSSVSQRANLPAMKILILLLSIVALANPAVAQVFSFTPEQMARYTPENPFPRFADGRPKVPDALLARLMKSVAVEDAWGILRGKGYMNQYVEGMQMLHPGQKLVGRAFTAQYMPARPDLSGVVDADAKAHGFPNGQNQRVIDQLQLNDVPVIDLMGPLLGHNFGGSNLHAAIYGATHTGAIIDGDVRDVGGLLAIPGHQVYFREGFPAAVTSVNILGINTPVTIGNAIVMPGDVVLGDRTGLIFIPPHLVQQVVETAELTRIHDDWTQEKFLTGKFKASQLYPGPLTPELQKEYDAYVKKRLAEVSQP
jgi:4-hydroxy-4-methyl-2-oxoglutarate aldolase